MAKTKGGRDGRLFGPMYTEPKGSNLGPEAVGGPKGGKTPPDPLGYLSRKGSKDK